MGLNLADLIYLSGIALICLSIGSLIIPKLLDWPSEINKMPRLHGQIFWTYAIYILGMNLFFGIVSLITSTALIDKSILATALTLYMFLYWLGRIFIQFFYFDSSQLPKKAIFTIGEVLLLIVFFFVTIVYGWAFIHNISG